MNHSRLDIQQQSLHHGLRFDVQGTLVGHQGSSPHGYSRRAPCNFGEIHWVVQCQTGPSISCSRIQPKELWTPKPAAILCKEPPAVVSPAPCSLTYLCCSPVFSSGKYFLVIYRFYCIILNFCEIRVSIRCVTISKISSYYI